jgi:hypothetical protein
MIQAEHRKLPAVHDDKLLMRGVEEVVAHSGYHIYRAPDAALVSKCNKPSLL